MSIIENTPKIKAILHTTHDIFKFLDLPLITVLFATAGSLPQGRIQDLIRGGAPDRDRPKTAILGPQFCRILVLGPHFWWSGGGPGPRGPPWIRPCTCPIIISIPISLTTHALRIDMFKLLCHKSNNSGVVLEVFL